MLLFGYIEGMTYFCDEEKIDKEKKGKGRKREKEK